MKFQTKNAYCNIHKVILIIQNNFPEESIKLASFFGIQTLKISSTEKDYLEIANAVRESYSSH